MASQAFEVCWAPENLGSFLRWVIICDPLELRAFGVLVWVSPTTANSLQLKEQQLLVYDCYLRVSVRSEQDSQFTCLLYCVFGEHFSPNFNYLRVAGGIRYLTIYFAVNIFLFQQFAEKHLLVSILMKGKKSSLRRCPYILHSPHEEG